MNRTLILLAALTLTGCAAPKFPTASQEDFNACKATGWEAGQQVPTAKVIILGPLLARRPAQIDAFRACMVAKGNTPG